MARRIELPDLDLLVDVAPTADGSPSLSYQLNAPDPDLRLRYERFGPVELKLHPLDYFKDFFRRVEDLSEGQHAEERLKASSHTLFRELLPQPLQQLLWDLQGKAVTLQIRSQEPWVPWELLALEGVRAGKTVSGPFLCEAFALTRWLGEGEGPSRLPLKSVAAIVPQEPGVPSAGQELELLRSLAGCNVRRIPADRQDVTEALAAGEYDGIHFTGHGIEFRDKDPDRAELLLDDDWLSPDDIAGEVRNLGLASL